VLRTITPQEWEEFYLWFDQHPHPDFAAGRLDKAIERALSNEQNNRVQPL
jgi:hypothetical protein